MELGYPLGLQPLEKEGEKLTAEKAKKIADSVLEDRRTRIQNLLVDLIESTIIPDITSYAGRGYYSCQVSSKSLDFKEVFSGSKVLESFNVSEHGDQLISLLTDLGYKCYFGDCDYLIIRWK